MRSECKQCEEMGPGPHWKKMDAVCSKCGKRVKKVLDLHHTRAILCSLDCEASYWLDLVF